MNNMICWDCVLKHLSGALSYGKEILSGHTKGADLDHRPDFLGELVNTEHHLELMDREVFNMVSNFRKEIQARKCMLTFNDLEAVRHMYLKVEQMSESTSEVQMRESAHAFKNNFPVQSYGRQEPMVGNALLPVYAENLDIVFDYVDNLEMFKFSYDSLKKYASDYGRIYVLKSDTDLNGFDVEIVNKSLYEFCKDDKLSGDFLLIGQNMAFLRNCEAKKARPAFSHKITPEMQKTVQYLNRKGYQEHICLWDHCTPQPVNKAMYLELMKDVETQYPLTVYYSLKNEEKILNVRNIAANIERPVCCSTKSQLRSAVFVNWKDVKCFQYLCDYLNQSNA